MTKIGLYFGSFNPVHIGHLMIANYFHAFTDLDEVWMIVTPQNPWKKHHHLIATQHRVKMLEIATENTHWLKVSDFEKDMKQPFFTYQSLQFLRENHPQNSFILLIGGDNTEKFDQWKNYQEILKHHEVWGFPRNAEFNKITVKGIQLFNAPQFEISSKFIRESLNKGMDMKYFLPNGVSEYIQQNQLYKIK